MSNDTNNIREQRDRFLAFSFAASDLLLEVDTDGYIVFAIGASKALSGIDSETLIGSPWLDIFSKKRRIKLIAMKKRARDGKRSNPLHVQLHEDIATEQDAIVSAIKMPDNDHFYVTVSFVSDVMQRLAEASEQIEEEKLNKDNFVKHANAAIEKAKEQGKDLDLTLFDLGEQTESIKEKLGVEQWGQFSESITDILESFSVDGKTASQISEGRYSLLHDESVTSESIQEQIAELSRETELGEEELNLTTKTVDTDAGALNEKEASRALFYTLNEFEKKGADLSVQTLQSGFKSFLADNAQKIQEFKSIIQNLNFMMHFQPIVDLQTYNLKHFEMLARFANGGNTQEWILFGEDIGMAAEFDFAVCEVAINYIRYNASNNNMSFAMNISGQSIQNEEFFNKLLGKLEDKDNLHKRLIFEITESNAIKELEQVNEYVTELQKRGFKVCLDDFGAGSASFQYLHQLHVDYLKIDGLYTQRILESKRDYVMIKNLVQMCKDLDVGIVAERVENEEEAAALRELGIDYGQGYFFSKPTKKPEYIPPKIPEKV